MDADTRTLSAVVVVHNEEQNLAACLACLAFADERVVVLDRCTDRSREIAARFTDRIFEGSWPREGDRRNFAAARAVGTWILDIDADERVGAALAEEIRRTVATSPFDRHAIPFDNWVGGRLIRHGWGATVGISSKTVLFRTGTRTVGPERVHPRVSFTGRQGPALTGRITHLIYRDAADMIRRLDRYSTLRALDLRERGAEETLGRNLGRFFARFYKCYVRRQGHREGHWGVLIALVAGLYPLFSFLKWSLTATESGTADPAADAAPDHRSPPGQPSQTPA